jgi:hypothetical protein
MLVFTPAVNKNKWYKHYLYLFPPPRTVNTVTHSYGTSSVLPILLLGNDRQNSGCRFHAIKFFLAFSSAKLLVQSFGWTECLKQLFRNCAFLKEIYCPRGLQI